MNSANISKINQLLRAWPAGTVATSSWLGKQGIYQQLAHQYEKSGWIQKIGHGAFVRWGEDTDWTGGVYALQEQMQMPVHVGGKTALQLKGYAYFVSLGEGGVVYLFGEPESHLPLWFVNHKWKRPIAYKMPRLFGSKRNLGLTHHTLGTYSIQVSSPERAIMEQLHLVPNEDSFEEAVNIMDMLRTLRPKLIQELLACCRSIKVKRLFLALAEQTNQDWFQDLDVKKVNLGRGKRHLVQGGIFNRKYQITLPKSVGVEKSNKTK